MRLEFALVFLQRAPVTSQCIPGRARPPSVDFTTTESTKSASNSPTEAVAPTETTSKPRRPAKQNAWIMKPSKVFTDQWKGRRENNQRTPHVRSTQLQTIPAGKGRVFLEKYRFVRHPEVSQECIIRPGKTSGLFGRSYPCQLRIFSCPIINQLDSHLKRWSYTFHVTRICRFNA